MIQYKTNSFNQLHMGSKKYILYSKSLS